jgi:hypothetical protein
VKKNLSDSKKNSRNRYLLKRFGITEEQYAKLLQDQDEACAVCKRPARSFKTRLCVDHDHRTGHVRGLLCNYCNRRIVGRHRRDAGAILLKAAFEYLEREYPGYLVPPHIKKKKKNGRNVLLQRKRRSKL